MAAISRCLRRIGGNLSEHSVILLNNKHEITVARNPSADIVIFSIMISKKHALLKERKDGQWTITDQCSTNGIYVNKKKISPGIPEVLHFGDIIQLGKCSEKDSDYFLYVFTDSDVKELSEHSFKEIDQEDCKSKKNCHETENNFFLRRKEKKFSLAVKQQLKKQNIEISAKILEAERQVKKMKKELAEKECAEQILKQEVAEKERQMTAALKNEQSKLKKEQSKLQQLQDCLDAELKRKEEALFGQLKNEKDKYLEEKMSIEKELQQEMERKLEEKNKEIEAKLLAEKEKLEKIIVTKELEHIFLEKQLESVRADNLAQKDHAFQIREGIVTNMTQLVEMELQCIICSELFIQATTLNCSHTFCLTCISEWSKRKKECPICRSAITNFTKSLVLDNYIDKMVELLNDDMKAKRKEFIEERKKIIPSLSGLQSTSCYPIIISDDSFSDSEPNYSYGEDDSSDASVEGLPGTYYGGYGRCFSCGSRGHWATGCPF